MLYLKDYTEQEKQENLQKFQTYTKRDDSFLSIIFDKLINYFPKEKIYHLINNDNYGEYSFITNTIDEKFRETQQKIEKLDLCLSFDYYLEQYEVKYSFGGNSEYINIKIFSNSSIKYKIIEDEDGFYSMYNSYGKYIFEIIIYSKDSILIKTSNQKIFPMTLSTSSYYFSGIFEILYNIFSEYTPIFKDLIRENNYSYINCQISDLFKFYNKKQLLEHIFKTDLKKVVNKHTLNDSYKICCAMKILPEKDKYLAYELLRDKYTLNMSYPFKKNYNSKIRKEDIGIGLLGVYMMGQIKSSENFYNIHAFKKEILEFLYYTQKEYGLVNVHKTSLKKLIKANEIYRIEEESKHIKNFKVNKKDIFSEINLPSKFIRINNKHELIKISKKISLNLLKYSDKLSKGNLAMYNITFEDYIYLVVIKYNAKSKRNKFTLDSIKNNKNEMVNYTMTRDINYFLKKANNKTMEVLI